MARKLLIRLAMLSGVSGPAFLFQMGCIDQDLVVRGFLQTVNEFLVFMGDNLTAGLR